jgi:hypothetical protein
VSWTLWEPAEGRGGREVLKLISSPLELPGLAYLSPGPWELPFWRTLTLR